MLRFTAKNYVFKEARPNRFIYRASMWINKFYALGSRRHKIKSMNVCGKDHIITLNSNPNIRLIFVANHSTHSDVELLMEAQRQCGIWGCIMAAHEVFARNRIQSWIMQRVGAFSINRENADRQSIQEAMKIIHDKRFGLTLFPEGNVAFTNEEVMPFLDGAALMAIKAQRSFKDKTQVLIIPTSIRLTHTQDVRAKLYKQWSKLIQELSSQGLSIPVKEDAPFHQKIELLGYAILGQGLKKRGLHNSINLKSWLNNPDSTMQEIKESILTELESEMCVEAKGSQENRARTIRAQLAKMRIENSADSESIERLDNKSILLLRVQTYAATYLRDSPSIDRCSETLEKLREDSSDTLIRPISQRHAHIYFGNPILVNGKRISELTKELENAVNNGLTHFKNPHIGGEMFEQ